ncbi:MAG TPA: sulfatase [Acidobacteriota bacterium]|nr:sulfatase [Acidobacteriota bacterium]HNT17590.1 sulfatase [Acidobacteriota bacterium]
MIIILITLDCLRRDHFGNELTPVFNRGLADWASFTNGFSQSQNTLSSHFTMLTSSYLFQHGVYSNFRGKKLPSHSMDKRLKEAGFGTKAVCGVSFLSDLLGNQIGGKDDYFDFSGGRIMNAFKRRIRGERRPAEKVVASGLKWLLESPPGEGKFLWMHFFDAHMAYSAPRRFMKKFVPRERSSKSVREQLTDRGWFSPYFKEYGKKVPLDHFPRSYKAAVSYIDHTLGLFFSMLKQFGLFDDALIFLTSDHGECLNGDHDIYCAHKKLFDETINVPFFVKFPGSEFGGRSSDLIVEHTDIAPTAVGYVTGRTPEYMGTDLRELLSGRAAPRKYAFSEHVDNYMRSVRDGDNIFVEIVEGMENKWGMKVEREKLFRRNGDPLADAGLESAMLSEMSSFMSKNASSSEGDDLGRDDKIEEQLRSLGYL